MLCEKESERQRQVDRGAVGTEMAIMVAIVVAIAIGLGAVMLASAQNHQACIPAQPGDAIPAGCNGTTPVPDS